MLPTAMGWHAFYCLGSPCWPCRPACRLPLLLPQPSDVSISHSPGSTSELGSAWQPRMPRMELAGVTTPSWRTTCALSAAASAAPAAGAQRGQRNTVRAAEGCPQGHCLASSKPSVCARPPTRCTVRRQHIRCCSGQAWLAAWPIVGVGGWMGTGVEGDGGKGGGGLGGGGAAGAGAQPGGAGVEPGPHPCGPASPWRSS